MLLLTHSRRAAHNLLTRCLMKLGFSNGVAVLAAITNQLPVTGGGLLSEITLSPGNKISIFHDVALTAANFAII